MSDIIVQKKNHSVLQIQCEPGVANELNDFFAFETPGYKYMPAYKSGRWDGLTRLFNIRNNELPVGLFDYLTEFIGPRKYELEIEHNNFYGHPEAVDDLCPKELLEFIKSLKLPFNIREYQFNAVHQALTSKRIILLSPTGSGKSLIIYVLMRYLMESMSNRLLIVVPTTSLVQQMFDDFSKYSENDETFDVTETCHRIYAGAPKHNVKERVYISTWQSIYNLPGDWFQQFDVVFGDEVHTFKAKSLSGIMNKSREAGYRIGTTGTLDGTQTHKLVLESLFGRVKYVTTTKALIDDDTLAELKIDILSLRYSLEDSQEILKAKDYHKEIDFIVGNEKRNRIIRNLALDQEGNTLVLFQFVEKHGKILYDQIVANAHKRRKIFFVSGQTDTEIREQVRHIVENEKNAIIVASLGTFSTGVNIRNLHNIIFAAPSKSQVKVLQSIGRGLRKSDDGRGTKLYDIVDDMSHRNKKNYTLVHGLERIKMYKKEGFEYKLFQLKM